MRVNIVVAIASNGVIGHDSDLPWRLPADLQHFKTVTMNHPIIMGRKTHESIGRALPGRLNIVISRQASYSAAGCSVASSLSAALAIAGAADEVMIVGGAHLYQEALAVAQRIIMTEVHACPAGDTRFPQFDRANWIETSRTRHLADERNAYDYSFVVLERNQE